MDAAELPSEDVSEMLRDSLRGFLGEHWSADRLRLGPSPQEVSAIWTELVGQGIASLGCDLDEGGLREILLVMAELGRAACPAPMFSAALANLALSNSKSAAAVELLEALRAGSARATFSFGTLDPDRGAGSIKIREQRATGLLRFAEVAGSCTHLLVAIDQSTLARVRLDDAGVDIVPTRAVGAWGLCELRLNAASATHLALEGVLVGDLLLKAKLMLAARAQGAARRAFELAADYAKERHQRSEGRRCSTSSVISPSK
jgi:alkylation response protein AidB-like acyl-CoA dehydrogenase